MMNGKEYPVRVNITQAGIYKIGIDKAVRGVYATVAVGVGWDFNGEVSMIDASTTKWEPTIEFEPEKTSKLVINASAPTQVYIRMV